MITIEQRAHDLAVAITSQYQNTMIDLQRKNVSKDNKVTLSYDTDRIADVYCECYDHLCKDLHKRMD